MSKHLPGPWDIIDQYIMAADESVICQWRSYSDEANARLIAAAPDLLAALKLCEPFCKGHQETPEKVARFKAVRAALAKAEE